MLILLYIVLAYASYKLIMTIVRFRLEKRAKDGIEMGIKLLEEHIKEVKGNIKTLPSTLLMSEVTRSVDTVGVISSSKDNIPKQYVDRIATMLSDYVLLLSEELQQRSKAS
jgi:hypothetical protein